MARISRNKKIKNATPLKYNGIKFKSKLEVLCYKTLMDNGLYPLYEKKTFVLWKGYKPTIRFYNRRRGVFKEDNLKLRDITYTPDFTLEYNNYLVVIEVKGFENAIFPLKKRMFRKHLELYEKKSIYFEVRSKTEMLMAIDIIKKLK